MAKKQEAIDYSKPLKNDKYERFCQEYVVDNNATQAAVRAGYSEKTAGSKGTQLLQIVSIQNRLTFLQLQLSQETGVTAKRVIQGFAKIAFGTVTKTLTNKNKLRALENLAKHLGLYGKDNSQRADAMTRLLERIDGETRGLPE